MTGWLILCCRKYLQNIVSSKNMASYQSTNKRLGTLNGSREAKTGSTGEEKARHVESLLRKLYAKVDELEAVCKEEKELYSLLKRKGRKTIPKFDPQLLPRVVASQQRCAETAFNNLDIFKRNSRSVGKKVTLDHSVREKEIINDGDTKSGKAIDTLSWNWKATHVRKKKPADTVSNAPTEITSVKENSWYGSLDRNMKKKRRAFLDRNRRHTKTVGSLAGLNVESIEMLQPDEQYAYGLPTVENKFDVEKIVKTQIPPVIPPHRNATIASNINRFSDRRDVSYNWQIQPNHGYSRSHPAAIFPTSISTSIIERNTSSTSRWFDSSVDTVGSPLESTEVLPPFSDSISVTDVNFNRLAISSPTEASERSSRSSENGDAKNSFVNESSKPFEMSDYYKYSAKYRSQNKGKISSSKTKEAKIQRVNGTVNIISDASIRVGPPEVITPLQQHSETQKSDSPEAFDPTVVPKLPPKLRHIKGGSAISNSALCLSERHKDHVADLCNGNVCIRDVNREAWVQTNPTIV